jgi:quercetin dioxygenase-like cupin family protein
MSTRRVVTGTSADGASLIARDEYVEPVTVAALPGHAWHRLWGFDALPSHPADHAGSSAVHHFPPPGGMRFTLFTVPPADTVRPRLTRALRRELDERLPGRATHMNADQAGMHQTTSVDLIVVLDGQVTLDLDDGASVDLHAGDCVVQNGTRHAWRNTGSAGCTMAIVLLGTG